MPTRIDLGSPHGRTMEERHFWNTLRKVRAVTYDWKNQNVWVMEDGSRTDLDKRHYLSFEDFCKGANAHIITDADLIVSLLGSNIVVHLVNCSLDIRKFSVAAERLKAQAD